MRKVKLTESTFLNIPAGIDPELKAPCAYRYNVKTIGYKDDAKQVRLYAVPLNKTLLEKQRKPRKAKTVEEMEDIKLNSFTSGLEKEKLVRDLLEDKSGKEESIKKSKARTISKIYNIARSNDWEYFFTLTLDPEKVDRTNYDEITDKMKKWLNNMKHNYSKDLRYLLVPELHKDGKSYHFHGLMSEMGNMELVNSGKKFVNKFGEVVEIFNLKQYSLGFSNFQRISKPERVTKYITKYISKELCAVTDGKKRYWISKNLNKPEVSVELKDLTDDYIKMFLDSSTYVKSVEIEGTKQVVTYLEMPGNKQAEC